MTKFIGNRIGSGVTFGGNGGIFNYFSQNYLSSNNNWSYVFPYNNKVVFTSTQQWTVPSGVTSIGVKAWGGGALGAYVEARTIPVTPATVYYILFSGGVGGGSNFAGIFQCTAGNQTQGNAVLIAAGQGGGGSGGFGGDFNYGGAAVGAYSAGQSIAGGAIPSQGGSKGSEPSGGPGNDGGALSGGSGNPGGGAGGGGGYFGGGGGYRPRPDLGMPIGGSGGGGVSYCITSGVSGRLSISGYQGLPRTNDPDYPGTNPSLVIYY